MTGFSSAAPSAVASCGGDPALCAELARQLAEMEEAGTYAPLAGDAYAANDPDSPDPGPPAGWSRKSRSPDEMRDLLGRPDMSDEDIQNMFEPEGTSYRAMLYENDESGDLVLAYRGTVTGEDWKNNAMQGAGMQSDHYERAKDLASTLDLAAEENGSNLTITGHSLGGGMAGAAALTPVARQSRLIPPEFTRTPCPVLICRRHRTRLRTMSWTAMR